MFHYTVTVTKDVTNQLPGEEPFTGHQYNETYDANGALLMRLVVRYRRFRSLRAALVYYQAWKRQAKQDPRLCACFHFGAVHSISLADLPVPEAVSR